MSRPDRAVPGVDASSITITQTTADQPLRTAGVLHPGAMGVTVAASLRQGGTSVSWASAGRGADTRSRAEGAGLLDAVTLGDLCSSSDLLLSVCPPDAALALARAVAATEFTGVYVDANAVSPRTTTEIGRIVAEGGAAFVDGGIIGPPATQAGTTRLYLSGACAPAVAALFEGAPLEPRVLDGTVGAASALKMAYAAHTKGTAALLIAVQALARASHVAEALQAEWELSQPGLSARADGAARGAAPKAWRWVGEMAEIAATFSDEGLPDGFHRAAGEIFERLAGFKDDEDVDLDAVVSQVGKAAATRPTPG